jgi:hypothetical protein
MEFHLHGTFSALGGQQGGLPTVVILVVLTLNQLEKLSNDEKCDETCDNARIYISNLPPHATVEEL